MLAVHNLFKSFAATTALSDFSCNIASDEIVALLGPSGCGKSTLLRVIAGLETADRGSITFAGQPIDALPAHQRGFGLMFQDYALFPHLDVAANIAYGLGSQRHSQATIAVRVAELLELVDLAAYGQRQIDQLSGGERQRVALARSLAPNPRLLMLDEPLGALDRSLRERLLLELRAILKRVQMPSIYVTHDQTEAFVIADRIMLMNAGRIIQQGPPEQIYCQPASRFVAKFLGFNNLVPATVGTSDGTTVLLDTPLGRLHATISKPYVSGMRVWALLRPEAASIATSGVNQIQGVLRERSFRGSTNRVTVVCAEVEPLVFELPTRNLPTPGSRITLTLDPHAISVIAAED